MKNVRIGFMIFVVLFSFACEKDEPVTGVTLDEENISLNVGENKSLVATVQPADADNKTVQWNSDNEAVATVDDKGVITGIAMGDAVITVTTDDGSKTASCSVTVIRSYTGTLSVDQNNGSFFKQQDVSIVLEKTSESKVRMVMLGVKFSAHMPLTLDMTVEDIAVTSDGLALSGDGLIPSAMGGPFPNYTIYELAGSLIQENITLSMICGGFPLSFSGTAGN